MELYKRIEKDNLRLSVYYDNDLCHNPRDWDNLGTMICAHRRHRLGDEQADVEDIEDVAKDKDNIVLPLYLYDHSGICMSTMPYSCSWDSGQVGIIYVDKDDVRREFKVKRITKKLKNKVLDILTNEVITYSHYLEGNVFFYEIEKKKQCETCENIEWEHVDSCGGFYGYDFEDNGILELVKDFGFTKEDLNDY